ncbi:MAG: chloride channel protein [Lentisphaeria bacterium]|nr:chloride channel protein [Lentisphaeria bacterium]
MKRLFFHFRRYWLQRAIILCRNKFGERGLVIALSFFIGAAGAVAAALLKILVTFLEKCSLWIFHHPGEALERFGWTALFFLTPLVGIILSYTIQRLFGGVRYAKSLSPLILALHLHKTAIPLKEIWTHILSAGLAVGFGGSAGLEAPSVLTGAAIGANTGSKLHIDKKQRLLLIGCGTSAAISAIFNSPIGGVLFAVEVLLPEFSVGALVPMLISSGVATVVYRIIFSKSAEPMLAITADWRTDAVPFYLLCAVVSAVIGVYVIRTAYSMGAEMRRRIPNSKLRLFTGGALLCVLLLLFPILRGQGYSFIVHAFNGDLQALKQSAPLLHFLGNDALIFTLIIIACILLKVITSVLTVESGGDGGIFAPAMFIGAFTGFAFARLVNMTGIIELQEANFVVAGMCGVFTAVMRAPLTGVFLIAEVTGGYILLVPLMISSAVSWFVARKLEPESIYRKALIENKLLVGDRDHATLQRLPVRLSVDKDYPALHVNDRACDLAELLESKHTTRNIYPVLDDHGYLQGVVHLDKTLAAMLNPQLFNTLLIFDLMVPPRVTLSSDDDLAWAMTNIERYGVNYLPVRDQDGKFMGFISKSSIFSRYRQSVREADTF